MPTLTDSLVTSLQGRAKEYHVWDRKTPGLCVRVRPSGHRTFVLFSRLTRGGPLKKIKIANVGAISLQDARKIARRLMGEIANGQDPTAKSKSTTSVAEVYESYRRIHFPNLAKNHARARELSFSKYILPEFGKWEIGSLKRGDIRHLTDKIKKRYPVAATSVHRAISAYLVVREEASKPLIGSQISCQRRLWDCRLSWADGAEACNFIFGIPLNRTS
jgi:hypothetical protein